MKRTHRLDARTYRRIRNYRYSGMSQNEIADRVGYSRSAISYILKHPKKWIDREDVEEREARVEAHRQRILALGLTGDGTES